MRFRFAAGLGCLLLPAICHAQSGFIAPDGINRYPGVTVWCPNGTGVAQCNFGGGGGGGSGAVTINLGATPVSASHPFPVTDSLLESLVSGGALTIGGGVAIKGVPTVTISGTPTVGVAAGTNVIGGVTQSGPWQVSLSGGLPAGGNAIGSVSVANFPVTQTVSGSVNISALPPLPTGSNTIGTVNLAPGSAGSVTAPGSAGTLAEAVQGVAGGVPMPVSGAVTEGGVWSVGITSLPPLPGGANAIGSVSVSNLPATQAVSGAVSVSALPALPPGTNAIGSVTVSNLPATQPVSATSLPLPAGASMDATAAAPQAPVAPAAAAATRSVLVGCQAATTLPSFAAGQQGAVPCDTSGRLYVTTVPSANNVPSFLQAVTSGGAIPFSAANAAGSCMATSVKSSSGMVYNYSISNSNATGVWFRLFAGAVAPTCGSSTPAKRIFVPPGGTVALSTDVGWVFATGIGFDVTSGSGADSDAATVSAANSVLVNIDYK